MSCASCSVMGVSARAPAGAASNANRPAANRTAITVRFIGNLPYATKGDCNLARDYRLSIAQTELTNRLILVRNFFRDCIELPPVFDNCALDTEVRAEA